MTASTARVTSLTTPGSECAPAFGYQVQGQNCQMVFTSVTGHLMEIDFPGWGSAG
jgi:hypothetical protein